ncbi:glycosyltransferase 87 family protein [Frankia sp. Cr2]|uniref:glycosyltransferase 87 family protein n=1 Tax=Frankia sp. Cr2 TaxID=3073932 RepID=UPI002AD52710|nr:glycosyltransferase 87 family protein [Frankia sp. Cr2]
MSADMITDATARPHLQPGVGRPRSRWAMVTASAALVGVLGLEYAVIAQPGPLPGRAPVLYLTLGWWAAAALGVVLLIRVAPRRVAAGLLLAGAVAVHGLAITSGPRMSDDLYRYVWDSRVQASGIDPYRYATDSPELAHLHDAWLWPDDGGCAAIGRGPGCTRLNYPRAHTIYPPVAQAYFTVVHYLPGPPREHKVQFYAALASLALTVLLMRTLAVSGRDPRLAAAYAWTPLAGLDIGIDAHVDVVAALAAVGGLALLSPRIGDPGGSPWRPSARRAAVAGVLLGVAVAVKLYPALLLPAAARRHRLVVLTSAIGVVALSYLPHVAVVGTDVLGFLPQYLSVEGYQDGGRFLLLGLIGLTGTSAKAVAGVVLAAVMIAIWRSGPDRVGAERGALWLFGTAFLVATPVQPWYGLLLVVLAVLAGRLEWLAVAAAPYILYMALFTDLAVTDNIARPGGYLLGAAVVGVVGAGRSVVSARARSSRPGSCRRRGRCRSCRSPWPR